MELWPQSHGSVSEVFLCCFISFFLSSFNVSSQQAFSEALIKDCYLIISSNWFLPCGFAAKEMNFSMLSSDASYRGIFIEL